MLGRTCPTFLGPSRREAAGAERGSRTGVSLQRRLLQGEPALEIVQSAIALKVLCALALVLLGGILLYLAMSASRRRRPEPALLPDHSAQTRHAGGVATHADAMSAKYTAERPTEDDLQAAALGPRGEPGRTSPARMTPQRAKKTPKYLEPGHTS